MNQIYLFFIFWNIIAAQRVFEREDFIPIFPYSKKLLLLHNKDPSSTATSTTTQIATSPTKSTVSSIPFIISKKSTTPIMPMPSPTINDLEDEIDNLHKCWNVTVESRNDHLMDSCLIKQCTCKEVQECNKIAFQSSDQCKQTCKSHLSYFGTFIDNCLSCFNGSSEEFQQIIEGFGNYFEKHGHQFCSKGPGQVFILKKNNTNYLESYPAKEELKDITKNMDKITKTARNIFVQLRRLETCVMKCFKEKTVECYKKSECDIKIPSKIFRDKMYETYLPLKRQIHKNAVKSCQCLAFKQMIKKLVGICAHLGNPFLMRQLI